MREIIDEALSGLDLGLIKAAVEGVSRKRMYPEEADHMATASADRHPNFHVLTDTIHDELTEPMDSVTSPDYRRGVAETLDMVEMVLNEIASLESARDHFPDGIRIPSEAGDIKL